MRLHQIENQQLLSKHTYRQSNTTLSNSDTKQQIDAWYETALVTEPTPYWLSDGIITDWQQSLNDWFADVAVPRHQLLDSKWRSYVTQLHYIHYLKSQQLYLAQQAAAIDTRRADIKFKLAQAETQANDILTGKTSRRNTQ